MQTVVQDNHVLRMEEVTMNTTVMLLDVDAYENGDITFKPYLINSRERLLFILDVVEMNRGFVWSA